jgi:hypothetical protein
MTDSSRVFLLAASVGLILAVVLGALSRFGDVDFGGWVVYVWPTFIVLGGISGHASLGTELTAIAVAAFLNAVLYGLVGWTLFALVRLFSRN